LVYPDGNGAGGETGGVVVLEGKGVEIVGICILASFPSSEDGGDVIGGLLTVGVAGVVVGANGAESGGIGASKGAVNAALHAGQNVAFPARSSAMVTRSLHVGQNTCMGVLAVSDYAGHTVPEGLPGPRKLGDCADQRQKERTTPAHWCTVKEMEW
jgi:hypothetical protein